MTAVKPSRAARTPAQLAEMLGLYEWQVNRGQLDGLLPRRDRSKGWSADLADEIVHSYHGPHLDRLRERIGTVPDGSAWETASRLAQHFGFDELHADTVRELHREGYLTITFWSGEWPVYDGRSIETFMDRPREEGYGIIARAILDGETLMADQVAERLEVRRVDVDHLVRAGLLKPVRIGRTGHWSKSRDPGLPLYRAGDVVLLAGRRDIDWDAVRNAGRGQRSPLAKLPDAPAGGAS